MAAIHSLSTKKDKLNFIRTVKVQDIVFDPAFVSIVRSFIEDGDLKVTEIGHQLLLSVIADAPDSSRVIIGRRAILSLAYDERVISDLLYAMGGEYRRFTTDTTTSTISYNLDAIKICNYLVAKGFIAECEKKNGIIIIRKQ